MATGMIKEKEGRLYARVSQYMDRHAMVRPGETVLAGVSGGADSVCLFLVLLRMSREKNFALEAVHIHHGLRASADGDAAFVEDLCTKAGVPCTLVRKDVAALAEEWGTGVEEAGRRIRYRAFEERRRLLCRETGTDCRIAVAHHLEDQAETVLFHLCRGTDLRGASGMQPVSGAIIRPLLQEKREDIEDFLREQGAAWREDETNLDTAYTRNYLRREIFPRLREGVNPAAADRIARFADACAGADRYLAEETDRALARCVEPAFSGLPPACPEKKAGPGPDRPLPPPEAEGTETMTDGLEGGAARARGPILVRREALLREDPYIRGRILYRCLAEAAGGSRDLGTVHVEAVRGLCEGDRDGRLSMPGRVTVIRTGGRVCFVPQGRQPVFTTGPEAGLEPGAATGPDAELQPDFTTGPEAGLEPGTATGPEAGLQPGAAAGSGAGQVRDGLCFPVDASEYVCRVREFDGDLSAIPQNKYTKWFDYDKIGMFPVFRTRQPGDRMTLRGPQGSFSKKLARILLDAGVPAGIREHLVFPFCAKEALWVPGIRMGDLCKADPSTRRILEICWIPGGQGGERETKEPVV